MRFVLVAVSCLWLSACAWETLDSSYAKAQDAIDAGMVRKGWIPAWIPAEATDLREVHNLDSNVSELSFAMPRASRIRLSPDCKSIPYSETEPAWIGRAWWPDEDALQRSYVFFECRADVAHHSRFVAISKGGDRVLHWRTYAR